MKPALSLAALALLALLRPGAPRAPDTLAPDRPIASLIPARCSVFVEGSGLVPVLEQGLEHPFVTALTESELGRALLTGSPLSPADALARADAWLGAPAGPLLAEVARAGLGLGFDPVAKKTVIVARGSDADAVARDLELVFHALERQFGWPGALARPQRTWSGADVWALGEAYVARRGALLVLGNEDELVEETLALADDPLGKGLLERDGFEALLDRRASGAALWAWVDLAALEPGADEGFRKLRQANRAPPAQALLGAELSAMLSARALSLSLIARDERGFELVASAFEAPCSRTLAPRARAGEAPAELAGAAAASALLYRDYSRYFTERSELFAPEELPGFAEALTNGALFFAGQDLGEDVLSRVSPWVRLVAREIEVEPAARPEILLPGLALVAVLRDEQDGEAWTSAFQTIVSVANVDRAQKGERGMRLFLAREGSTEISGARLAAPRPGDGVDVAYNFEPAIAVVGRHLVLGTHTSLVRAVVRELAGAEPLPAAGARETLDLDAASWRAVLDRNLEFLVARKMLEEGKDHDAAARELAGQQRALASLEGVHVQLDAPAPESPELRVELRFPRQASPR